LISRASKRGVLGVEDNGSEVQVIIGQAVEQLYPEVQKLVGKTNGTAAPEEGGKKSIGQMASSFLLMMAGIMSPVVPALTTAGFISVLLVLLQLCGIITSTSTTYVILNGFAQSAFYFLPRLRRIYRGTQVRDRTRPCHAARGGASLS